MTRPKVAPENRQRTAQACISCKRRKQKCNGLTPCNTCQKRSFMCVYSDRDPLTPPENPSATKKRSIDYDNDTRANSESLSPSAVQPADRSPPPLSPPAHSPQLHRPTSHPRPSNNGHVADPKPQPRRIVKPEPVSLGPPARVLPNFPVLDLDRHNGPAMSRATSQSGADEEALMYSQTRMLQDPTGRLLYVGDAASLSFLQLLRMMVESVAGPSSFTEDPRRHKILESQFSLPASSRQTHMIPDKGTAIVLADAFFTSTLGILRVFGRDEFFNVLESCYQDPLSMDPQWLCLINLVFAIGLMLATPNEGTPEAFTIERLRSEPIDRAEVFYLNAKSLNDPLTGFEDADFWSVKALLLISYYMLAKSKRNTAFAFLGMAIRSAYALGLHREETMEIFRPEERANRRDVWRSLFVADRFLSCSLGRPLAICEQSCSGDTLNPPRSASDGGLNSVASYDEISRHALDAAVRSCSVLGNILRRVYQQRKINTRLAQEIADICKVWPKALAPCLHWGQAASSGPAQGMAVLHVNLFYCHSIVLLTRPFFLFILNAEIQDDFNQNFKASPTKRGYARMEKFGESCVIGSSHTILLVQNALEAGYLPRRDPIMMYFLFAAVLVLLANEFANLYYVSVADQQISNVITILTYSAEADPQASRLLYIVSTFSEAVIRQRLRRAQQQQQQHPQMTYSASLPSGGPTSAPNPYSTSQPPNSTALPSMRLHRQNVPSYGSSPSTPKFSGIGDVPSAGSPTPFGAFKNLYQMSPTAAASIPGPIGSPRPGGPGGPAPTSTNNPSSQAPNPLIAAMGASQQAARATPPPSGSGPGPERHISLSSLLDLNALEQTPRMPMGDGGDSAGPEEHIDFDVLWAWPTNTPAAGTPRLSGSLQGSSAVGGSGGPGGGGAMNSGGTPNSAAGSGGGGLQAVGGGPRSAPTSSDVMQGISDSHVPLFGVTET